MRLEPQPTPPPTTSPSRFVLFGCSDTSTDPHPLHRALCSYPENHGLAFPAYREQLQRAFDTEVTVMLAAEGLLPDPAAQAAWDIADQRAQLIWEQIEDLGVRDPYLNFNSADEYVMAQNIMPALASDKIDYRAIKERVDLAEYVSRYTTLRQVGPQLKGKCPLPGHQDDTPSFNVYPDKHFHCYGCQAHGDIFDFVSLMGADRDELTA